MDKLDKLQCGGVYKKLGKSWRVYQNLTLSFILFECDLALYKYANNNKAIFLISNADTIFEKY